MYLDRCSCANDRHQGFSLIELMIVISVIGILASIAVPNYFKTTKRAKFSDVILAASTYKLPATVAFLSNRVDNVNDLNAGEKGIPDNILNGDAVSPVVSTVYLTNGVITATSTEEFDFETYTLRAEYSGGGVKWIPGGTCFASALC